MPCICNCGRVMDCGETTCPLCEGVCYETDGHPSQRDMEDEQ